MNEYCCTLYNVKQMENGRKWGKVNLFHKNTDNLKVAKIMQIISEIALQTNDEK